MAALVVFGVLLAVLSGAAAIDVAHDRGRPALAWGLAGLVFPVAAPFLVWLMPPNPRRFGRCEWCREWMRPKATVCAHCAREQTAADPVGPGA